MFSVIFQEVMINIGDVGTDYEHGLQLLKKLNEFRGSGSGVSLFLNEHTEFTVLTFSIAAGLGTLGEFSDTYQEGELENWIECVLFQEVTVDDAHIKAINSLAARLERQNSDELATVKQRRQQLNDRWHPTYWENVLMMMMMMTVVMFVLQEENYFYRSQVPLPLFNQKSCNVLYTYCSVIIYLLDLL